MGYILVTGGLGFIGSHCCVELLNSNYDIIVVDNNSNSKPEIIGKINEITGKKLIFYKIDLLNINDLEIIFKQYNIWAVIHFAASKAVNESISKPLMYYENNIITTINLLKLMDKYNCKKIIFSSSATVYGNQISPMNENMETGRSITNPYGKTKFFIEEILKDLHISDNTWSIVILRYFNPVGSHQSGLIGEDPIGIPNNLFPHILRSINGGTIKIFGNDYNTNDGTCIRDFIHVVDLARGHLSAISILNINGIHIYNLGTGCGTSVLELIKTFEKVNNIKINYEFAPRRKGDTDKVYADVSKANKELNWKTVKTLEDICRDGFNFYIKNKFDNVNS